MVLLAYLPEIAAFVLLMAMATQVPQIGAILILLELGLVGLLFIFRTTAFIDVVKRWWWLLLMPLIATLSGLWSDVPMISFRYGAQYLFTCVVGVLIACTMSPRRYIATLMVALFVFCLLCIAYGRQGTSADGMVLIGLTGSKNQMAYAAQVLLMAALAVLLMRNMAAPLRGIAFLSLPLCLYLLAGTNSATAVLMAFGSSAVLLGLWWSQRLPPGGRLGALIGTAVIFSPLTLLIPEAIEFTNHFVFDTLGKDPTLTGRTILWAHADALIAERPLLGYGYQAIWMGESSETIGLKRLVDIEDGRQFHFHHAFRIIAVDTGLFGLLAFSGALVAVGWAGLKQLLLRPAVETSFFFLLFTLMVMRGFTDAIIGPFSVHTLLFFGACVYAFWKLEPAAEQAMQPAPRARRRRGPATPAY
ncbi:MAG TPA: O-antigen ligase family protein [Vitreimonas sp.]|uniref:O-antigen ligase family protein n=1 Tax=Vitreimonas sp. TaxID=3069702 RepID=UPI002D412DC5|nr:O-antigen ligase family protein [Vitreimonas sp.]HYD86966.1 O-antigen ligase family protein [Vitreimonas sp.]